MYTLQYFVFLQVPSGVYAICKVLQKEVGAIGFLFNVFYGDCLIFVGFLTLSSVFLGGRGEGGGKKERTSSPFGVRQLYLWG